MTTTELMKCIGRIENDLIVEAGTEKESGKAPALCPVKRSVLLAAAIAVFLLLAGCTVACIQNYGPMLETILGTNNRATYHPDMISGVYYEPGGARTELDAELAEKYITPYIFSVNQSIPDEDRVLTAISCIVDRTSCSAAVYLKLENPPEYDVYNSGWLLFRSESTRDIWYIHPTAIGQRDVIGRCIIDDASTTDTELYFVFLFSCEPDCTALEICAGHSGNTLRIELPETTDMPSISLENGDIQLTPWGIKFSHPLLIQDDSPDSIGRGNHELAIQFKDGSEYLLSRHTNWGDEDDFNGYTYGMALNMDLDSYVYVYNRVVELGEVAAIRINQHIYPV